MRVNIVPTESSGWLVGRVIEELSNRNNWDVGKYDESYDINYFVLYHALIENIKNIDKQKTIIAAKFTHPEDSKYYIAARESDLLVMQSPKYQRVVGGRVIPDGIDVELFKPKITIGVNFRSYSSGRKGEFLIDKLKELSFVEIKTPKDISEYASEKDWLDSLPSFYRSVDYFLVPSLLEGGPLPAIEALACGTNVIGPKSVGNLEMFDIIDFKAGDSASLTNVVTKLYNKKIEISERASSLTWKKFCDENLAYFQEYYEKINILHK